MFPTIKDQKRRNHDQLQLSEVGVTHKSTLSANKFYWLSQSGFIVKGFQGDNGVNLVMMAQKPLRHHEEIHVHCVKHNRYDCFHFLCYFFILTPPLCLPTAGSISQSFLRSLLWLIVYYVRVEKEIKEIIPYLCQSV